MDLSHKDYTQVLAKLTTVNDMLAWQLPSDIPTINRVAEEVKGCLKILNSYLDDDSESTTQLELFPEESEEDVNDYQ